MSTPDTLQPKNRRYTGLLNLLFLCFTGGVLLFLLNAPPETTPPLPQDDAHTVFRHMKKKKAEQQCTPCHSAKGTAPLADTHPPPYRCLFCHKRE
ncbi:MAG: hypothetical protein CSA34_08040 [Desulfobulbus propionicus]|nr:MAG: hypothetical protein CSA34_08040 [Desulfobulbus propionicus]